MGEEVVLKIPKREHSKIESAWIDLFLPLFIHPKIEKLVRHIEVRRVTVVSNPSATSIKVFGRPFFCHRGRACWQNAPMKTSAERTKTRQTVSVGRNGRASRKWFGAEK